MTMTTTGTSENARIVPGPLTLTAAADALLDAITDAGPDDPRWLSAGPLVSAAAQRLREALGTPVNGSWMSMSAVVREADFALAARPLLAEALVVDPGAAEQFVGLAVAAALALGWGPGGYSAMEGT